MNNSWAIYDDSMFNKAELNIHESRRLKLLADIA